MKVRETELKGGDNVSITFDFSKLKGLIRENKLTQAEFATGIGISATQLYERFNNKVPFDTVEIELAMRLFNLPNKMIHEVFFVKEEEKS